MKRACIALVAGLVGHASAQPAPASPTCVPADAWVSLHEHGGTAIVRAFDKSQARSRWFQLDASGAAASEVAKEPDIAPELSPTIKRDRKGTTICLGTTCKRVGRKLRAALAPPKQRKPKHDENKFADTLTAEILIHVSPALDIVVVGFSTAFDVRRDRVITAKLPRELAEHRPSFSSWRLLGNVLVARWNAPCVYCANAAMVDITGKVLSSAFAQGTEVALSETRAAIVSAGPRTSVTFVNANGSVSQSLELDTVAHRARSAVRIDDRTLAVMWRTSTAHEVAWVDAPPSSAPKLVSKRAIAICR